MEGNQNSFPVVRFKEPLLDMFRNSDMWTKLGFGDQGKRRKPPSKEVRLSALTEILSMVPVRFSIKTKHNWERLRKKADELLENAGDDDTGRLLAKFARRFQQAAAGPSNLLKEIAIRALNDLRQARLDEFDAVETLLVGKGPPKGSAESPKVALQLAFDVDDDGFSSRLYSREVCQYVKRILPKKPNGGRDPGGGENRSACAYTGEPSALQMTPFPKVNLPVLNKEFPLVSMFSDAGCNRRYGLTDFRIVPVSEEAAERMRDALTHIVKPKWKGRTWRAVANGKFETSRGRKTELSDLLVVYVDGKPEIPAPIADLFGTGEGQQEKQFEVDAKGVCDALDGIEKERPGSKLNLFLLRKASEGQAHVVLTDTPSVREILDAARWWQAAAANVPTVRLGPRRTPHPDRIVKLLSEAWVANGHKSFKVAGIGLGEVLDVLLRKPTKMRAAAKQMLDLAVRRLGPLFLGVFGTNDMNEFPTAFRISPERLEKKHYCSRIKLWSGYAMLGDSRFANPAYLRQGVPYEYRNS